MMNVFENALYESFKKSCVKVGLEVTYADKKFVLSNKGEKVFSGDTLETQRFLKDYHYQPSPRRAA